MKQVFKVFLFFAFIYSMCPWFTWNLDFRVIWGALVLMSFLYFFTNKKDLRPISYDIIPILFVFLCILWMQKSTIWAFLYGLGVVWVVFVLLKLDFSFVNDIVVFFTKGLSVILGVSLLFYLINSFGVQLPHNIIYFRESLSYDSFQNYFLFIRSDNESGFRFSSVFLEPGHMTLGVAPLLFINQFNLKNKYVWILLLAEIFSFSLTGYITTFFTFFICKVVIQKNKKQKILSLVGILLIIMIASLIINALSPDAFQELILDRLVFEDGQLSGNNRTNIVFASAFYSFIHSSDLFLGMGTFDADEFFYGHGNSGWQVYTYIYGLVGIILCLLAYMYPCLAKQRTKKTVGLSVLLLMLLLPNTYPMWWCMLLHLTLGTSHLIGNSNGSIK